MIKTLFYIFIIHIFFVWFNSLFVEKFLQEMKLRITTKRHIKDKEKNVVKNKKMHDEQKGWLFNKIEIKKFKKKGAIGKKILKYKGNPDNLLGTKKWF